MKYAIEFDTMSMGGDYMDTRRLTITTEHELKVNDPKKSMVLGRFLVEFARLTGVRCSCVKIKRLNVMEDC